MEDLEFTNIEDIIYPQLNESQLLELYKKPLVVWLDNSVDVRHYSTKQFLRERRSLYDYNIPSYYILPVGKEVIVPEGRRRIIECRRWRDKRNREVIMLHIEKYGWWVKHDGVSQPNPDEIFKSDLSVSLHYRFDIPAPIQV